MASEERLRELEEKYEGFTVYDNQGSKIGKVDDLFVDEKDNEEYIGVKMGFLGRKSTLIPTEIVRVNESERTIEVSESKDHVKEAPSFDDDEDVTAAYEDRIRRHFGLESLQESSGRGSYGAGSGSASGAASGAAAGGASSDHDEGHEGGTSGYATGEDRGTSSGGAHDADETSSGTETRPGETEGSGTTVSGERGRYEGSGTSETTGASSGSRPTTSKQTEETETFEEGGRTKIRRRIIREEVVDAEDQN
jgi:sporulation protein YlmC with PRC-barrel domain